MSFLSQKLACLLYNAADDGDVDPFLVSRILGVTKNKPKVFSVYDRNSALTLPRSSWRTPVVGSGVIPGRARRVVNDAYIRFLQEI